MTIYDITEADEVEIGLCPCGKGYNGHTTHTYTDGHEATGPRLDRDTDTWVCTTCGYIIHVWSPTFDSAELRHGG